MGIKVYAIESGAVLKELSALEEENSFDDVSRKLPDGLYSTFRTYNHGLQVVGLRTHLDRLYKPSKIQGIEPSAAEEELRLGLRKALSAYRSQEARVRICLSLTEQPGRVIIMVDQLILLDEEVYSNGVQVVTVQLERVAPRIKSSAFIQKSNQERKILANQHLFEGLMVKKGQILEGMTSNFYALQKSKIVTARYGILLGVTRRLVLRLIRAKRIDIDYRSLRIDEIPAIDEAFITSSSRGVVPVISVDGIQIGQGKPGNLSGALRRSYDAYVMDNAETI